MGDLIKRHQPCPDCGSSDALSLYTDGTYCFSCKRGKKPDELEDEEEYEEDTKQMPSTPQLKATGVVKEIPDRNISKFTCAKYNVMIDDEGKHIYPYYNADTEHVASKIRTPHKNFRIEGDVTDVGLFGQHLFKSGGKYITLVEGELDALATHQIFDCKWPVVSIRSGAAGSCKDIEANYEYLMSFDNIIICFDNDKAGKLYAKKASELLSPKARIMRMRYKDACEYLENYEIEEFKSDWWNAEIYTPDGIVAGEGLWQKMLEGPMQSVVDYPFAGINKLTYGIRPSELVTVCAGTGTGKSSFLREIIYHIFKNTEDNIGLMFMEESVRTTAESLMSLHLNKLLHLPTTATTDEEYKDAFDQTLGTSRFFFFDHFGSNTIENIISRIRYLVRALGCRFIVLDHISILVSSQENSMDERRTIDACVTKLRTVVQELGITLFMVSHLRRPSTGSHELGSATVSLSDLRGSHSIGQLSDIVIGLERNGQADCGVERNTTITRVIKNRFSGITGPSGDLLYDTETGRMQETYLNSDDEL